MQTLGKIVESLSWESLILAGVVASINAIGQIVVFWIASKKFNTYEVFARNLFFASFTAVLATSPVSVAAMIKIGLQTNAPIPEGMWRDLSIFTVILVVSVLIFNVIIFGLVGIYNYKIRILNNNFILRYAELLEKDPQKVMDVMNRYGF